MREILIFMRQEDAEIVAATFLAWLTEDSERLGSFLGWSGESPDSLRQRLSDPGLLLAVMDFVMGDEALLLEACRALDLPPETPGRVRAALPGGADMHWT